VSVDALEAVDELLDERLPGFGPEQAAADATVLFDGESEGEKHFDILLDVFCGVGVKRFVVEGFGEPGSVEAEINADVAILFVGGVVELGAEAEEAHSGLLRLPDGIECDGFRDLGLAGVGRPELPAHLELVGGVIVKLLRGLGDCVFDERGGAVLQAIVENVSALVDGRFTEGDWVCARGDDSRILGDKCELAHDRYHRSWQGV